MRLLVEELAGARGGQTLFEGLNFSLGPGEALLVTGPNGTGKTTLLRIMAGLLAPAAGRIGWEDGSRLGEASHFLGAANAMKPVLTVRENLHFWARFLHASGPEDAKAGLLPEAALDAVGLAEVASLPFGVLSTGQKRRVAIARLLLASRRLWLLDEPMSGLDARAEARFEATMADHLSSGGIVVAAVHAPVRLAAAREIRLGGTEPELSAAESLTGAVS